MSAIEGCTFALLLVLSSRLPDIVGTSEVFGSADHVLVVLLSCSAFAATCAIRSEATEGYRVFAREVVRSALVRGLRVAVVVAIFATPVCYAYILVGNHRISMVLASSVGIVSISLVPLATMLARVLQGPFLALRRAAFIGDRSCWDRLRQTSGGLERLPDVVGFLDPAWDDDISRSGDQVARGQETRLKEFLRRTAPDEVVIASRDGRGRASAVAGFPVSEILKLKARGVRVVEFSEFWERETGRVDLHTLRTSRLLFSQKFFPSPITCFFKRIFDVVLAWLLLVACCPLFVLIAIMLAIFSPGPIIFKQERVGLHARRFTVYKFRSMYVDSERISGPIWASKHDRRITPIGALLRRTRLDELPQLWNVLKGDMSLVGPRPERVEFVEMLSRSLPFYDVRHCIKPGLTGWAQINQGYAASVDASAEKLSYDLFYLLHCSIILDLVILARTVGVVVWQEGSH